MSINLGTIVNKNIHIDDTDAVVFTGQAYIKVEVGGRVEFIIHIEDGVINVAGTGVSAAIYIKPIAANKVIIKKVAGE